MSLILPLSDPCLEAYVDKRTDQQVILCYGDKVLFLICPVFKSTGDLAYVAKDFLTSLVAQYRKRKQKLDVQIICDYPAWIARQNPDIQVIGSWLEKTEITFLTGRNSQILLSVGIMKKESK